MSTRSLKKLALLLTFWIALHASSLRAQILNPAGTSPVFVEISNSGQLVDAGSNSTSDTLLKTGAGTRMVWFPYKSAFRAGTVSGSQWDASNMGVNSIALGYNTTASNWGSMAFGMGTTASGWYSTASGYYNTAIGTWSTAFGAGTLAYGFFSTTFGENTTANGWGSTALGISTTANGDYSTASGSNTTASAYAEFVVGRYNDTTGTSSSSSWISTDPLFEVGNGTSGTHSNAFVVYKNGNGALEGSLQVGAGGDIPMFSGY